MFGSIFSASSFEINSVLTLLASARRLISYSCSSSFSLFVTTSFLVALTSIPFSEQNFFIKEFPFKQCWAFLESEV